MDTRLRNAHCYTYAIALLALAVLLFCPARAKAQLTPPGGSQWPTNKELDSWTFFDSTNWTSDTGCAPISFTNLNYSDLGDFYSLVVDDTAPVWLQYPIETATVTNLTVDTGSLVFWFAPSSWSSATVGGAGPGAWAQLINVGEMTTDASVGYWGLSVDPYGSNLWFVVEDGLGNEYRLTTPISWTTNYFHFIGLTYCNTNVSLYLDGQLATNDPAGLNIGPGTNALSGGLFFGSDTNGLYQGHGLFNQIITYNTLLYSNDMQTIYNYDYGIDMMNPFNRAMNIRSAPTTNTTFTPLSNVITGPGNLQLVGSAPVCVSGANVWLTNVIAGSSGNGTMNLEFTIEGGSNNVPYDVFANSVLSFGVNGVPWAWEGQGYQCNTYILTNMPNTACFLILGTPQDTDVDGLTDAYELLVSKTSPTNYSSDASGMADGWEVLYFGTNNVAPNGDPDGDGLTTFQEWLLRSKNYNPVQWDSFTNSIVGDGYQDFSGDGLANLMESSFGGFLMTNNASWKVNITGDGIPDEYKTMVGLNTNSAAPVLGLPSYSKNPIQ